MGALAVHFFLSPHLDDAVLSCGGQIAQLVASGEPVQVVTVMAGDVPADLAGSEFVPELHERWGLGASPVAARRAEDRAALHTLRLKDGIIHLAFPDCVYRVGPAGTPLYPSRDAIFGPVAESEREEIVSQVVHALDRLELPPDMQVLLPLTAGHHVDHQITRAAGERWADQRRPVTYYEDYPYAEQPEEVRQALGGEAWSARLVELDERALAAKIGAIACYRSQLSSFFAHDAEMAARVRAYAEGVGSGRPAERLWVRETE